MNTEDKRPENKILVSNPGKQYTHQLVLALEKNHIDYRFFTSFWYKPGRFPFNLISFFPGKIREKLEKELKKRYYEKLGGKYIYQCPFFEFIRELSDKLFGQTFSEKMQFYRDRLHDKWVSAKIDNGYSVIIGYEESCLESFRKAKETGVTTVLDLAQVHYKAIDIIGRKNAAFNHLYQNKRLRNKINKIKEEELALADYIICLSDFAKETLVNHGFLPGNIFVARLGFDPLKFLPKQNYSVSGKLKVVFAGTLTRRKGIDLILEVNRQLEEIMDLTLVGPMADAEDLLNACKGKYTWHPYMEQAELNLLLKQSDLFVFPSYLDSWAMVVVEAMASGLPVIISENTGAKEAVLNNSGFVIPAGNAEMLKKKISYFYNNRDALQKMGQSAAKEALSYTWDNYYKRMNNIILEIQACNEKERK